MLGLAGMMALTLCDILGFKGLGRSESQCLDMKLMRKDQQALYTYMILDIE